MKIKIILLLNIIFMVANICQARDKNIAYKKKLDGKWLFQLDLSNIGLSEEWFNHALVDTINLPGTTDENKKGILNVIKEVGRLTRVYTFYGPAWYQKKVEIPTEWKDKQIFFTMERTKTSSVWVDDNFAGTQNSLTTAHYYDLSRHLSPGKHRLTVCIDNKNNPPVGDPHQISDQTQTNWNGILGKVELEARDRIWMEDVQVYPNISKKKIDIKILFNNTCSGELILYANSWNSPVEHKVEPLKIACEADSGKYFMTSLTLGDSMQLWDEFSPALYHLSVDFESNQNSLIISDHKDVNFGMREFTTDGTHFQVNGKTIFLRGKHDACVFPKTGYAPMDVDEWVRIFKIAKSYGLNHYRFHTWCPPNAAFEAADIVGIYIAPELPLWGSLGSAREKFVGDVELKIDNSPVVQRYRYLLQEGKRILRAFGNHASFCMFELGNELSGDRDLMGSMVKEFRETDHRHLYAQGANNFLWKPRLSPGDDYWTTTITGGHYSTGNYFPDCRGLEVRGSYPVHTMGHINNNYPNTVYDYSNGIKDVPVPVIGHEIGQFQTYPDFNEIEKYNGVLKAKNFEIFRERLKNAGMLDQADDFFKASGALAVLCYREEIETAIRTNGFGGFQMLDLQVFPGQGTALVGILDAFMDSKGLIEPEEWRQFCSDVVLLARIEKYTWTNDETFSANLQIANYGSGDINHKILKWQLTGEDAKVLASGQIMSNFPQGQLSQAGEVNMNLSKIETPQKLNLRVELDNTDIKNSYPIWVYPTHVDNLIPKGITVSKELDDQTVKKLLAGEKVLLLPDSSSIKKAIPGAFQSDFWCYPMFKKYSPSGTLGILCNPNHPVFKYFPTEHHSNWQWWALLRYGQAMILDEMPTEFKPIVQVIDNFERNHKLGTIIECSVGKGKLLVCSCNLQKQQKLPEARQLLYSLLHYMQTNYFLPSQSLEINQLTKFLNKKN